MPRRKGKIEDTLTVLLTQEFQRRDLDAEPQAPLQGKGRGWADVLVRLGRLSIIIEAKNGQGEVDRQAALADCRKRIENGHCTAAVAVCYPLDATPANFSQVLIDYAVLDADTENPEWLSGQPSEVAEAVKMAPAQLGNADLAAAGLRGELDKALANLSSLQKQDLARAGFAHYAGTQAQQIQGQKSAGELRKGYIRLGSEKIRHRRHPRYAGNCQRDDVSRPAG